MRVLVLGANGFVGRRVVSALAATRWATPIRSVRRRVTGEHIVLDATDPMAMTRSLDAVDAVVNCVTGNAAAIVANATALAATIGDRRVVHLSSMAVYGSATGIVGEDTPPLGDMSDYAAAKAEAERSLRGVSDVVILRPGCIYGAGSVQWSLRIADMLARRRIGDLGEHGDGSSNVVHIDDVVAAILASLRLRSAEATFNLAMAGAPDWNGYFLAFARALGAVPIARIPEWRLRMETNLAAVPLKLGEAAKLRLPPPITPTLAGLWRHDIRLDATRATSMLGLGWTPLAKGVADAAAWVQRVRQDA